MTQVVTCPACATRLKVPEGFAGSGKLLKCPRCQEKIRFADDALEPEYSKARQERHSDVSQRRASRTRAEANEDEMDDIDDRPAKSRNRNQKRPAANQESTLLGEETWVLRRRQVFVLRTMFALRYEFVRPGTNETLGVVDERPPLWVRLLRGFPRLRRFLPNNFEVRDGDNEPLLFTLRYTGLALQKTIEVLDADGELLVSLVLKMFSLVKNFTVYGPDQEKAAEFRFKMGDYRKGQVPRMSLFGADGEEWGFMTGEDHMEALQMIQEGKKVAVKVKFLAPKPGLFISLNGDAARSANRKTLVLAAAVVMKLFGLDVMFASP
jgi:hypothetical protein